MYAYTTEQEAQAAADKLKEELKQVLPDAETRVHENMGWFAGVHTDYVSVSVYPCSRYTCLIADNPRHIGAGRADWSAKDKGPFTDPVTAVRCALESVNAFVNRLERARVAINQEIHL